MTVIAEGRDGPAEPPRPGPATADVRVVVVPHSGSGARDGTAGGPTGREAEFAAFMAGSSTALARTAWLLCGDEHQAEELVQQAFVRVWIHWGKARRGEPLAYARRVLANLRIDSWRKHRREVLADPVALPERVVAPSADLHAERDRLVRALALLGRRQRRVVVLRHLEGLSEKETAAALGVSVGTVKSQSSRGLARLRGLLDDHGRSASGRDTPDHDRPGRIEPGRDERRGSAR
ncbi:SigE family RNA polymerase sigma factor [Myceligenerans indicum]|uniref:SigE family RNA polymerase sigma factor n=1 Tax=Myceligenerans indicum TaxID=2593663 RepID=A0ABS1LKU6_9MICO|nr:SigE family RNA polymerase sigma factor [Myceligenerans indicum]MBL0886856.1 SigE family RNA polymerase sigma factor [Myceligenerans indicum]